MARKSTQNLVQKATLLISKAEFSQELTECICNARLILNIPLTPISKPSRLPYGYGSHLQHIEYDQENFEEFKKEMNKWIQYVSELLKQSFDVPNNEYQRDFINTGQTLLATGNTDWVKVFKDEIKQKCDYIESLIERLKFIPCSVAIENDSDSKGQLKEESRRVFIVHGHDEATRQNVELLIRNLGYEPIVLFKQPNQGATIIEKLEKETDGVAYAIVLYTKCDEGRAIGESELKPRARQNVVFEHGLMCGILGRRKVAALLEPGVEWPGDLSGIVYIDLDLHGGWQLILAKEMKAAGLEIDLNNL